MERKRLPTKRWVEAGYTEKSEANRRLHNQPDAPISTGDVSRGTSCLSDCDAETLLVDKKKNYRLKLNRGLGHAPVGVSKQGVNGLYDMGANVWEWAKLSSDSRHQATMGGSWWYGNSNAWQITAQPSQNTWLLFILALGALLKTKPKEQIQFRHPPRDINGGCIKVCQTFLVCNSPTTQSIHLLIVS